MKEIYMVTRGQYSDYGICGVFSRREPAEGYAALFRDGRVESYPVDIARKHWFYTEVTMTKEGKVLEIKTEGFTLDGEPDSSPYHLFSDGNLNTRVVTRSKRRAVKVTNERRAQLIALNQWPPSERDLPNVQ